MWEPPIPADEADRLEDLRRLDILLTTPEEPLDNVTRRLAEIFDVPGAFISFIDEDTQYYKSEVGLPAQFAETRKEPRDISLCSYVVGTNEPLIVEDLTVDSRFRDSPGVLQFGIHFYAGAPLRGDSGLAIGSLCIVDHRPRTIGPREQAMLQLIAEGVMAQVRLQTASRQLLDRSLEIERDLHQAMDVQRFLLPEQCLEGGGWRIEHVYRPVEHLGGDFLDVQQRRDGSWAVLIADVSGHGTTAALTAALTKTAFVRAGAGSPAAVLSEMNRELSRVAPPGQLVTAQAVVLDTRVGRVTIASAGHPHPMLVRGGAVELIATENGPPLLVLDEVEYHDTVLEDLHVGDSVILYTDGAIEAGISAQEHLGVEGLRSLVGSLRAEHRLSLDGLLAELLRHAEGAFDDDVALLTIQRREAGTT
jgi:serine phosphatase RsbU (regulator of sigma subunit)